jgi:hypothetical protein
MFSGQAVTQWLHAVHNLLKMMKLEEKPHRFLPALDEFLPALDG